jgi:hypothetical protein
MTDAGSRHAARLAGTAREVGVAASLGDWQPVAWPW